MKWPTADSRPLDDDWRVLIKELSAFGVVGGICFAIDVVLFQLLYAHAGFGAVTAKFLATMVSMTVAYFGAPLLVLLPSRADGRPPGVPAVRGGERGHAAAQSRRWSPSSGTPWARRARSCCRLANITGIAAGTVIRYLSYRRWVFPAEAAVAGVQDRSAIR